MTDWNGLVGFEAWSAELEKLLAQAEQAAKEAGFPARLAVAKRLNAFIGASRPNDDSVKQLDELAAQTSVALMKSTIDERLAEITMRTTDYLRIVKDVETVTAEVEANAASIRLSAITDTIQATTQAIESVKKLKDVLGQSAMDKRALEAVEEAIAAIEALRTRTGKLL